MKRRNTCNAHIAGRTEADGNAGTAQTELPVSIVCTHDSSQDQADVPAEKRFARSGLQSRHPGRNVRRAGFSLIEVIIATAILMGSAVVLSRLAGMGREQSQKASLHAKAQELCEQTIAELLLQMRPPELVESMSLFPLPRPFEETLEESGESSLFAEAQVPQEPVLDEVNPEWRYSVRMDLLPNLPGMWSLTVVVVQGDETLERPVRFSLTRWISGPPPDGAFDELSQGFSDSTLPDQGGFL